MGLSNVDNQGIFLSTFDGFFEQKLKEPKPGSVQRVNKNGVTINVMRFNTLTGKLVKIEFKTTEQFGDFWSLSVQDDRLYKLDLSVGSSSTFYLLNRLLNEQLDLKAPMEFKVFAEVEGDVKKTVILVKQAGVFIPGVYTKDNPQDLPPMEQVMFKGKLQWDSSKRDAFMRGLIEEFVAPELAAYTEPVSAGDEPLDGPVDDADLPDWAKDEPVTDPFLAPEPVKTVAPPPAAAVPSGVAPNGQPVPPPRKQPIPPPTAKDEPKTTAPAPTVAKPPAKGRGHK